MRNNMIKIIARNILAACGSLVPIVLIQAYHVHIRPVGGHWPLWPWIIFTYALVFTANRGIMTGKSPLWRFIVIALLSALIASLWIFLFMYSGRLINAAVGGH